MSPVRPSPSGATGRKPEGQQLTIGGPSHFSLFGVPVRVGPGFLLMSGFFALSGMGRGGDAVRWALAWTLLVFVSILVHELGHALVVRAFGGRPAITLHALGGLTNYSLPSPLSRPRRIVVSLAGPFAGFALAGLVFVATHFLKVTAAQARIVSMVYMVNVGWGILNLLPVIPLDGGNVLAAALGPRHTFATAVISALVGTAAALFGFFQLQSIWLLVLFGTAAASAMSQARAAWSTGVDLRDGLDEQLAKAKAALDRGDLDDAFVLADDVVRRARTLPVRNGGYTALAWVHLARGEGSLARESLSHVQPIQAVDPYTLAAVEDASGRPRRAIEILEMARAQGVWNGEMTKLLVDLHAREGELDRAVDVATEEALSLSPEELRTVVTAAIEGGANRPAAALAGRLFELSGAPEDALLEARASAALGDVATALGALALALASGTIDPARVRDDPAFAALSGDERFEQILRSATS